MMWKGYSEESPEVMLSLCQRLAFTVQLQMVKPCRRQKLQACLCYARPIAEPFKMLLNGGGIYNKYWKLNYFL